MLDPILKVTVLLALVAIAAQQLRRSSAALRHMLWNFAIVAMVLIPVLTAIVPVRLRILPSDASAIGLVRPQPAAGARTDLAAGARTEDHGSKPIGVSDHAPVEAGVATAVTSAPATPLDLTQKLIIVWALGVLFLFARYTIGWVRVRAIARRSTTVTDEAWLQIADRAGRLLEVRAPIDIRRSSEVAMPFACGIMNPVIVLPAIADEWTQERREAVLMHEYAHISRGDLAMNMLSHVARALYWFHPLAWLASYRLRVEGERACDDAVLRAGALPSDYAEHLLSIVRSVGNTVPNVALAMARRSDFEGRLLAILEPGIPRGTLTRLRAAGLAAMFLVAVMPLSAMAPKLPASPSAEKQTELAELDRNETKMRTAESSKTVRSIVTAQSPAQLPAATPTGMPAQERQEQGSGSAPVNALIETLGDANAAVRVAAVQSLGQLQDPRAIAALSKALKEDTDPRVREAAANSLGEIDDSRAVPALLDALRTEKAPNVRTQIVKALGEIDDPSAVQGIAAVVKDPSVPVRRAAAWALGELEDPAAVPALTSMVRDEDSEVRRYVASALSEIENANALDALTILAKDVDAEVRQHAIDGLGNMEDMRTLPILVAALKDENAEVRQQAADGIGDLDNLRTAPPALIEALRDTDKDVRQQVASALGNIGDAGAVPALKRAVADADLDVRRQVVEALKDIGGVEAMEALVALLKDSDPEIRKTAAEALGKKHE
jgi:HEAT repeat protein/beta-lactamase regulating signal transducer with metallopeptidase domain